MELLQGELSEDVIKRFQVVVLTQSTFEEQRRLGDFCHANGIRFIIANTKGLFGYVHESMSNQGLFREAEGPAS